MTIKSSLLLLLLMAWNFNNLAQISNATKGSLYIQEVADQVEPVKILHAEHLYIDLIRDLWARKGEKEWNIAFGITDKLRFDSHEALIEYDWAPINRVGFEGELPFTFYSGIPEAYQDAIPSHQL